MVALSVSTIPCTRCGKKFKTYGVVEYLALKDKFITFGPLCSPCGTELAKLVDKYAKKA